MDPQDLADLAVIGAAKIGKGAVHFGQWSAEMTQEFGEQIRPHLAALYRASHDHLQGALDRFPRDPLPEAAAIRAARTAAPPADFPQDFPAPSEAAPKPAAEPPPAPPARKSPAMAGSLNLDRMDLSPAARARVVSAADRLGKGETLPHDVAAQAAKDLGLTPAMLADLTPGEVPSGVHPKIFDKAVRDLHAHVEEKAAQVFQETGGDASPAAQAARDAASADADALFAHDTARSRIAGQTLGGRTQIASPLEAATEQAQAKRQALAQVAALRQPEAAAPAMKVKTAGTGAKTYGARNTVFTEDKRAAALAGLKALGKNVSADATMGAATFAQALPHLVTLGGYHLEAGLRKFGDWAAQIDKDVPGLDDAQKQQVYAASRAAYAAGLTHTLKQTGQLVFADALAPTLGRQGTSDFLDALADHPKHPDLLGKVLSGGPLSAPEEAAVNALYRDHLPARGKAPTQQSLATLRGITQQFAKENARARLAANRAAQGPRAAQDALTRTLTGRLGKAGAAEFEARLKADPITAGDANRKSALGKLRAGTALTDAEARAVAGHLEDLKTGKRPAAPSDPSKLLTGIVRDAKAGRLGYDSAKAAVQGELKDLVPPERVGAVRAALAAVPDDDFKSLGDTFSRFYPGSLSDTFVFGLRSGLLSGPLTLKGIVASHLLGAAVEDTVTRAAAAAVDPFFAWLLNDKTGRSVQGFRPGATAQAIAEGVKAIPEGARYVKEGPTAMQLRGMSPGFRLHEQPGGHLEHEPAFGPATGLVRFFPRTHGAVFHVIGKALELRGRLEAAEIKAARTGQSAASHLHDPDVTKLALAYRREQLYANKNAAAELLNEASRRGGPLVDLAAPFRTVPSNLAMRGVEYSGAGLPLAAARAAGVRLTGKDFATRAEVAPHSLTPAEREEALRGFRANVSRQAGRGIVGAGLGLTGGAALTKAGVLTPPDEKAHEYGRINLGRYSFDTSRLEPVMAAPNLGGEMELAREGKPHDALAPFTNNPYFSIGDTATNFRESFNGKPGTAERLIGRELSEFIPTLLSQVGSYTDPSGETRKMAAIQDYLMNRTPGLREKLPTTGRAQSTNIKTTPIIGLLSPVAVQPRKPAEAGGGASSGRPSGPPRPPRGSGPPRSPQSLAPGVRSLSEYAK